ncbi:MAG: 4-(cytidine 5'-diphospho)-2-C-methyl-D-erythritol kinase [Gammaproteobacteria bacterium]|nr:4-(cytidine 5'-diphospho)-2-C-methyl-D-erythritol kinase [Gammaproteobacteria bacterium]
MKTRAWPAPAKLNLFLHVTGRRPDGYHNLQTVFQFLNYGDDLHFGLRDDGVIRATHVLPDIAEEHDLCVRAAQLLQAATNTRQGVDIRLEKRIPLGGGLGGGSSDAAATLVALNHLWQTGLTMEALASLGLQLGADVPVFIHGVAAWAEGVGDKLVPVTLPEPWYVVVTPPCRISTAEIFNLPDLTRASPPLTMRDFRAEQLPMYRNDCEATVCRRYPEVADALARLSAYAPARMTGTGSSVFAAFALERQAQHALERLALEPQASWQGFVAQGRNLSPLHTALASA